MCARVWRAFQVVFVCDKQVLQSRLLVEIPVVYGVVALQAVALPGPLEQLPGEGQAAEPLVVWLFPFLPPNMILPDATAW